MRQKLFYLLFFICFFVLVAKAGRLHTQCKCTSTKRAPEKKAKVIKKTSRVTANLNAFIFPVDSPFGLW